VNLGDIGRLLLTLGVLVALAGALLVGADRLGLGRLPGDLRFGSGNVRVYVPLATSLVVSLVLTILLNLFFRR
jgi:hypothetical protein